MKIIKDLSQYLEKRFAELLSSFNAVLSVRL